MNDFEINKGYTFTFKSKTASWLVLLNFIKFYQYELVILNIFLCFIYAFPIILVFIKNKRKNQNQPMPRILSMDYLKKGLKDYLRITFVEVLGGFFMITIPTYFGTYGIYMVFNLVQWNKYFNPNSDENIQNIS